MNVRIRHQKAIRPGIGSIAIALLMPALVVATTAASTIDVANSGFEILDLGSGPTAYEYGISGPGVGWNFVENGLDGGAGIAANGSNFLVVGAPNGNSDGVTSTVGQAAFIQEGDGTFNGPHAVAMNQLLTGFQTGTATVSFLAEGREIINYSQGPVPVDVYLDNTYLGTVTPPINVFTPVTFTAPITAGSHTLWFVGHESDQADKTTFIDNVSVVNTPVPEPSSIVLALLAALAVFAARRLSIGLELLPIRR